MRVMQLTTERLFQSGEFRRVQDRFLMRKDGIDIFPCQMWYAEEAKVVVGCAPLSQRGIHYGLNWAMWQFIYKVEQNRRVNQGYIAAVTGDDEKNTNLTLDGYWTVQQQKAKLNGYKPIAGNYGRPFIWIDKEGNPFAHPTPEEYEVEDEGLQFRNMPF